MIEAAINSLILGQVNALGTIGGAVEALGIAALSVVLSYTWGVVLGHSFKYGWLGRSLGVLGTLVYAMLLIGYHTVIAWYREVLAHGDNPEVAVSTALGFCLEYGWAGLQNLHTWGLLVVGAFCGGLACVAGYKSHDARIAAANAQIAKTHDAAKDKLQDLKNECLEGVNEAFCDAQQEIERRSTEGRDAAYTLRIGIAQARDLERDFNAQIQARVDLFRTAVLEYRRVNRLIRSDEAPVPAAWQHDPEPLETVKDTLDMSLVAEAESALGTLSERLKALQQKAADAQAAIEKEHSESLARMPEYFARVSSQGDDPGPDHGEQARLPAASVVRLAT